MNQIETRTRPELIAHTIHEVGRRQLSFLPEALLIALAKAALENEEAGIEGRIVEAGVALGGSALTIASAKSPDRPMSLYDTFGLIPAPSEHDGADVHQRWEVIASGQAQGFNGEQYYGYQEGLLEKVVRSFREVGIDPADNLIAFHAGDFRKTMSIHEPISLAHVDCDWYESALHCLTVMGPHISVGGRFVIDDYDSWSGARKATDEWLAENPDFRPERRDGRVHIFRTTAVEGDNR